VFAKNWRSVPGKRLASCSFKDSVLDMSDVGSRGGVSYIMVLFGGTFDIVAGVTQDCPFNADEE
jgi:hypothetical protein